MVPYYVRQAGTNKIQGIFWARNLDDLWGAVDEMCDPFDCEFAKPRSPGGLWHSLRFEDTGESRDGTEENDCEDCFVIHEIGYGVGELTIDELVGARSLQWRRFDPANVGHGMVARIMTQVAAAKSNEDDGADDAFTI